MINQMISDLKGRIEELETLHQQEVIENRRLMNIISIFDSDLPYDDGELTDENEPEN